MSTTPADSSTRFWTGRLAFYHPTPSGGGAVARLEFHPARPEREGCFFLELARQKTVAARNANGRLAATFDWEKKVTVKLGLLDVCSLLLVLEGKTAQAGSGRGGLFHDTAEANTVINLRHQTEPVVGFALEVSRKSKLGDSEVQRMRVVLTEGAAIGLRCVLQTAMFPMIYGCLAVEDGVPGSTVRQTTHPASAGRSDSPL